VAAKPSRHQSYNLLALALILVAELCGCHRSSSKADPPAVDVLTYHNDNARTGQNLHELTLSPANVNSEAFGKVGFLPVDGKVDAQPLLLSQLSVDGKGTHNVLYAATEHDSVYAFDTDTGALIWSKSLLGPGETPSDDLKCEQVTPEIGITGTPVIDRRRGPHGAMYVVAMSKDASGNYIQRIHALNLADGGELFGGPREIRASFPGNGDGSVDGTVAFDPRQYEDRTGLLLLNGVVYTTWASHCDARPYTGWVMGYSEASLNQLSVLNITPNGNEGAIWMSGAGPAADNAGNIYLLVGNGVFDSELDGHGFPNRGDYGNAFLKLSTSGGRLAVADYFEMSNQQQENDEDADLGSGGALVLPDLKDRSGKVWHLAVGAGKDRNVYVVNRDSMGKFHPDRDQIYQELPSVLAGGAFSMPAYFNGTVYYGGVEDSIRGFRIVDARLAAVPASQTANTFRFPGATPSISASGNMNSILWAVENGEQAVLHAYDATNLARELYNSKQAGQRDEFGPGNKFITPMIANGKVFVGTTNGVAVFGLLHR
jgi:outer membrane protein assembly factor BamB